MLRAAKPINLVHLQLRVSIRRVAALAATAELMYSIGTPGH